MLDFANLSNILINSLFLVIYFGYLVVGLLIYKQVGILCKMLGTNLSSLLKLTALIHLVMIIVAGLLAFVLK